MKDKMNKGSERMGTGNYNGWLPRSMRKRNKQPKSQTPGSSKDWNCKRDPLSSHMCKRNRSHKHPRYREWAQKHTGTKYPGRVGQ